MKPNTKIAQLLKGHRIDFVDHIVLDLIDNNETTYVLLAPINAYSFGVTNPFILSTKNKGYKFFGSLTTLLTHCVNKELLNKDKANYIQEKYHENPLNKSFYLDDDLVNALKHHFVDFAKHYIIDIVTPANTKLATKKTIMYLAPYDLEDYFITSSFGRETNYTCIENQMNSSAFNEVITRKQAKKYIKDYYKMKGRNSYEK